jgi:hypothetical protein
MGFSQDGAGSSGLPHRKLHSGFLTVRPGDPPAMSVLRTASRKAGTSVLASKRPAATIGQRRQVAVIRMFFHKHAWVAITRSSFRSYRNLAYPSSRQLCCLHGRLIAILVKCPAHDRFVLDVSIDLMIRPEGSSRSMIS